MSEPGAGKGGVLPPTDWSHIGRLKSATSQDHVVLLDTLARKYWTPLFQYLLWKGHADDDAKDLTQDFFEFALRTRLFEKADRSRGRFRPFLIESLNNFAANDRRRNATKKRRPPNGIGSLDELMEERYVHPGSLIETETPEVLFDRVWLREVVRNVLAALKAECDATGKQTHYLLFHARVVLPALDGEPLPSLEQLAHEFGLEFKQAANQVITARRAFIRLLKREIRGYVSSGKDADDELRDVMQIVLPEHSR